jgi:hypothetical protein
MDPSLNARLWDVSVEILRKRINLQSCGRNGEARLDIFRQVLDE